KNKDDVFSHFIQRELMVTQQELNQAVSNSTSPKEKIVNYIRTRYKAILEYKEKYPVLRTEYFHFYPLLDRIREGLTNYEITIITDILEEGVKKNMFRVDDVKATAKMVVTILKGVELPLVLDNENKIKASEIERFTKIFLKGIEKN
ncbi:MAG: TetR family transcriptional regulator C-terminal domain-containing protein, partial [Desulfobacteraceae bacterium]